MPPPVYRLANPIGFIAAGAALLLPLVVAPLAMSGIPGIKGMMTLTGADLFRDNRATLTLSTPDGTERGSESIPGLRFDSDRPYLIAVIALLVVGVAAVLIRHPLVRSTITAAAAGVAAILLSTVVPMTRHSIDAALVNDSAVPSLRNPDNLFLAPGTADAHGGSGYWWALGLLAAIVLANLIPIAVPGARPRPDEPAAPEPAPAGTPA